LAVVVLWHNRRSSFSACCLSCSLGWLLGLVILRFCVLFPGWLVPLCTLLRLCMLELVILRFVLSAGVDLSLFIGLPSRIRLLLLLPGKFLQNTLLFCLYSQM
jgi:predicted Co/Zn/Cd cation transporter (cation efflux family)